LDAIVSTLSLPIAVPSCTTLDDTMDRSTPPDNPASQYDSQPSTSTLAQVRNEVSNHPSPHQPPSVLQPEPSQSSPPSLIAFDDRLSPQAETPTGNNWAQNLMLCTQQVLQKACKRRRISSHGTKAVLTQRLIGVGVSSRAIALQLCEEYEEHGGEERGTPTRNRAQNWTMHESARLCHVLADPRNATSVARLYNGTPTRAEIDVGIHDPWSSEFVDMFNDRGYVCTVPLPRDGVTEAALLEFDPNRRPHDRTPEKLKTKWSVIRSKYTVARRNFEASGRNDATEFTKFAVGDEVSVYLHCVFYNLPALDNILRSLPEEAQAEEGLENTPRRTNQHGRKRKSSGADVINSGLEKMASALETPVTINLNSNSGSRTSGGQPLGEIKELMELEDSLRRKIKEAREQDDHEYEEECNTRLNLVKTSISRKMEAALGDSVD